MTLLEDNPVLFKSCPFHVTFVHLRGGLTKRQYEAMEQQTVSVAKAGERP